jgi:EAL domain-containing protein (putative c-di-GMP-specific phosphodiesterase class I)
LRACGTSRISASGSSQTTSGTGHASLAYLQKFPVGAIKIDQSFVRDMLTDTDSAVIVRSTIDLAHDLGLEVVAEGVEDRPCRDRLAQ